ncbi:MAG: peptide ABC transporter substrate-binding protein [Caldilineaceae bacterium]|nr:peptide ABC transporter substrate-binding protein [Caldilineaceae bacterium]
MYSFSVRFLSLLIIVAALVNGCAPQAAAPTTASNASSPAAPPATGRGVGDTLRLIWWQAPTILNPHLATGGKDTDASRVTYEPLASFNREGELVPFLAAEIPSLENGDVAADGKSVTWKLKADVKWSDGEPFTAADVKFTYDYIADPATGAVSGSSYSDVASVEVIDPTTVKVTFKEVTPVWERAFVGVPGMIIPQHIFQEYIGAKSSEAPANLKPVGTGAYQVVAFKPGDIIIFEPNPNFRESDKPYFSRVELKGGGDATSAARAVLQTGDADYAWNLQVEAQVLDQLAQAGKGTLLLNPGGNSERIELNYADPHQEVDGERASLTTPHPFFTDLRVRQAFSLAVDRQTIVEQLYGAAGVVTSNIVVAPLNVVSPNTSFEFNLEKAAALLDAAGWQDSDGDGLREKEGVKLQILFQSSVNPVRQKTQEIVKQALESIGFGVELKSVDSTVFFNNDPANPDTFKHFYADVQLYTTGNSNPDPGDYLEDFTCAEIVQKANEWSTGNLTRWCNPDYDALVAQAKTELDPTKRQAIYRQLNDILINEVVVIPVVHRTFPNGVSTTLDNVVLTPWDSQLWLLQDWVRKSP